MNNDILMLIPSRERPSALSQAIDSLYKNGTGRFDLLVLGGLITVGEGIVSLFNSVPHQLLEQYRFVGLCGDDSRMRTANWDRLVVERLAAKPGVLYGRDGIQDKKLATHPFISTTIPLALGYIFPPCLKALGADNALMGIAGRAGCLTYEPGLFTEHLHHSTGKSKADGQTTRHEAWLTRDLAALDVYERTELSRDIEIVKKALSIP